LDSEMASLFLRRFSNSAAQSSLWTQLGSAAHCSSEDESALSITFSYVFVQPFGISYLEPMAFTATPPFHGSTS
jgi:hypothetical protein